MQVLDPSIYNALSIATQHQQSNGIKMAPYYQTMLIMTSQRVQRGQIASKQTLRHC